jgi:queuosine precursor transporter
VEDVVIWLAAYILSIFAANAALAVFGLVPVGFGLMAPAGVFFVGLTFTLRDAVHERYGALGSTLAVLVGGAVSYLVSPSFAVASTVTFLVSELADLAVYTPIRKRHWLTAVALSNVVGLVVDSALFLWLAFGSLEFIAGLIIGKLWVTLATVAVLAAVRWARAQNDQHVCREYVGVGYCSACHTGER